MKQYGNNNWMKLASIMIAAAAVLTAAVAYIDDIGAQATACTVRIHQLEQRHKDLVLYLQHNQALLFQLDKRQAVMLSRQQAIMQKLGLPYDSNTCLTRRDESGNPAGQPVSPAHKEF